ncbi:MAG: hypothetical protein ACR2KT_16435 [Methylocella sp.]
MLDHSFRQDLYFSSYFNGGDRAASDCKSPYVLGNRVRDNLSECTVTTTSKDTSHAVLNVQNALPVVHS